MVTSTSPGVYTSENDFSQRPQRAISTIAAIVGEARRGPVGERTLITSESDYVNTFGKPDASVSWLGYSSVAYLNEGDRLYVTRVAPEAIFGGCTISWDGHFNTSSSWLSGEAQPMYMDILPSTLFHIYAINPGDWNKELFVRLIPDTKFNAGYFSLEIYVGNAAMPVEKWNCHLNYMVDGYGVQLNVEEQVNRKSSYIRIVQNHEHTELLSTPNRQLINTFDAGGDAMKMGIQLVGGADGRKPTMSELILAWDIYRDPEVVDLNLLINSGYANPDYQTALDELCKDRMDCVAILDVPSDMQEVSRAIQYRRTDLHVDSSYSALYTPDVYVGDKYNDIRLFVPPSGFVASAYAKTDRDYEAWFAPAGMIRGDLKVAGLREVYSQPKRDALYESQINAIRVIEGSGIKIWGADTLQVMPSALSNMSVRRLMIVIEKTISNTLLYSVFDPNSQSLRSKIEMLCRTFLKQIKDARGLYAYDAICDESNNRPDSIAAGDLIVDLWCDPTLPAKRIMFNAIINRTGVRVTGDV